MIRYFPATTTLFSREALCLEKQTGHSRSKITNNKFINTSVQKGCMEKVPGCWEHMSMVWSALKDARSDKLDLATIWLDIANAYGSIPHRVIFFALERYGVPQHWISFIKNYYVGIYSKSFSEHAPSNGTNICVVYLLVAHCP